MDEKLGIGIGVASTVAESALKNLPFATEATNKWADAFGVLSKNALYFSGVSDNLQNNVKQLVGIFSKDAVQSISNLTEKLKGQIAAYQQIDQEFIRLGRGADSKAYIESIRQQEFETARLGITLGQLISINKNLLESYTGANLILSRQTEEYEKNKKSITELVGFNQKFGVTQKDTIDILNLFNTTMEGGSKSAQKMSDNLLIFAQRTGQNAGKVFQQFNENVDRFSTLSADRAVASFQKLELAAARTGGSVSKVISAVERFDDIESGFQAGGQLNRVLSFMGGSFDTFKAMQATDEERATMLYQAIAQTGDRFQQLQTEQAKRAMVKQIQEASGLDTKTIVGLLNKSTNLASDIAELSKRPPVTEEFTERGREAAAMRATTAADLMKVQDQLMDLNPIISNLSDSVKSSTQAFTGFETQFIKNLDAKLKTGIEKAEGTEGFLEKAKTMFGELKNLPNEFEKAMQKLDQKIVPQTEGVLSRNTDIMDKLKISIDKHVEASGKQQQVNVHLTFSEKAKKLGLSAEVSAADAFSGMPESMSRVQG